MAETQTKEKELGAIIGLMKGAEADATIAAVSRQHPEVDIWDRGTFWQLSAEEEIYIDLDQVSEELGEDISITEWLVIMCTVVGRMETGDRYFLATSKLPTLD